MSSSPNSPTGSSTDSPESFFRRELGPPIPALEDFCSSKNPLTLSDVSDYDGRTYVVLALPDTLPEMTYGWDESSEATLKDSFVQRVLRNHSRQINSFFQRENKVTSYYRVWILWYGLMDGKEIIKGPWSSDEFRFHGIRYPDPALPIYNPQDIIVKRHSFWGDGTILEAMTGKEEFKCYIPPLLTSTNDHFRATLDNKISAMKKGQDRGGPKLKGLIGFRNEAGTCQVFGTVFEKITGFPLSKLSIPDMIRPRLITEVENGFKDLMERDQYWAGTGPESVIVTSDGQLYLPAVYGHYVPRVIPESDPNALNKVIDFLKRKTGLRRSERIISRQDTSWAVRQIDDRMRFKALAFDIRLMIYDLVLANCEKLFWAYGSLLSVESSNAGIILRKWRNGGLAEMLEEANSFFYEKNHFLVDVGWLYDFLSTSKNTSRIKEITIQIDARPSHGGIRDWKRGIQELVAKCHKLKDINLDIYFEPRPASFSGYVGHSVLQELRRVYGGRFKVVVLRECAWSMHELQNGILDWLNSSPS